MSFKQGDDIFHARLELTNYMPSNDPANMDATSQEMNDRRKRKATTTTGRKKTAEEKRSTVVVDNAGRIGAKR
jgi:hypothetical protein